MNNEQFSNEQIIIALKELIKTLEKDILILKNENGELKHKIKILEIAFFSKSGHCIY